MKAEIDNLYEAESFGTIWIPYHRNALALIDSFKTIANTAHELGLEYEPRNNKEDLDFRILPDAMVALNELGERLNLIDATTLIDAIGEDFLIVSRRRPSTVFLYPQKRIRTRRELLPRTYLNLLAIADYFDCRRGNHLSIADFLEQLGLGNFALRFNPEKVNIPSDQHSCGHEGQYYVTKLKCRCNFESGYHVMWECVYCWTSEGIHTPPKGLNK